MKKTPRHSELGRLWRKTRPQQTRHPCSANGCENQSSLSHLLKQRGIIDQITDPRNHVRELRTNRYRDNYYSLELVGWENALAFYGFCAQCDSKLFAEIENPAPIVPTKISEACQYSLRPVAHEIKKKEGNIPFLQMRDGHDNSSLRAKLRNVELELIVLRSICSRLQRPEEHEEFEFVARMIPRVEVCASSMLIHPTLVPCSAEWLEEAGSIPFNVVNFFPIGDASVVISLTHRNCSDVAKIFQRVIENQRVEIVQQFLSDMLVAQIEDWCVSEQVFSRLPPDFAALVTSVKTNQFGDFYRTFGSNLCKPF